MEKKIINEEILSDLELVSIQGGIAELNEYYTLSDGEAGLKINFCKKVFADCKKIC